ncbi:MAG: hypothetical protein ACJAWF_003227, partial [Candidatus Azotimanducaceae bacterium]
NWSDIFVNADKFPDIVAAEPNKYTLPPVPELKATQLQMVGWTEDEITSKVS